MLGGCKPILSWPLSEWLSVSVFKTNLLLRSEAICHSAKTSKEVQCIRSSFRLQVNLSQNGDECIVISIPNPHPGFSKEGDCYTHSPLFITMCM